MGVIVRSSAVETLLKLQIFNALSTALEVTDSVSIEPKLVQLGLVSYSIQLQLLYHTNQSVGAGWGQMLF